ncbi:MAG: AmmeMemoRadiSam system protein B [Treponema sp.]|nr:AmmeMemoRadiSam system protein B [Treponema sp.]
MHFTRILVLFTAIFFLWGCKDLKPGDSVPSPVWGGTVSHHELASKYIDDFFCKIKNNRDVKTFFIISPSHYGLSVYDYSIDNYSWKTKDGSVVSSDKEKVESIAGKLGVGYDTQVFYAEHGVFTLIPYIKRYFPDAKVVAVAVYGDPPVNVDLAQKLYEVIEPYFDENGQKENFLLISSDFSHHSGRKETDRKDKITQKFFNDGDLKNWFVCICDNRPGMFVLSKLTTEKTNVVHLVHTDSYKISGQDKDDITSYFFSLFSD